MKAKSIVMMAVAALAVTGCSNSGTGGTGKDAGTKPDSGTPQPPAAPTLGAQIDRMGRAGVNTALTDPFDISASVGGASENAVKDAYNADSTESAWVATHAAKVAFNLAVLDGLDRVCGNQLGAATGTVTPTRYNFLAGVLADDKLYLNSASGVCTTYLGVEANATGFALNGDCGGRTPTEDVIDETYSLLAVGMLSGVTDGIDNDSPGLNNDTFPFLAAPN